MCSPASRGIAKLPPKGTLIPHNYLETTTMKVITHQSPLIQNDSIDKNIDGSIRSAHTDITEESITASSTNEEDSTPSDYGSVSVSTGGSRTQELPSHSKKYNQDNSEIEPSHRIDSACEQERPRKGVNRKLYVEVTALVKSLSEDEEEVKSSHRCTARRLKERSADSSERLPLPVQECPSHGVNRKLYFEVTSLVKSLSEVEEDGETSLRCTARRIERRSADSSERPPSHECPNQAVSKKLYFDVTAIVKSLSEDEEVKTSRRFFSRSRNFPIRSSNVADYEPTEEESFSSLGSSSFWGDDTSCTSSIDNLSVFLPGESQELAQHEKEEGDDFSLSREFQEEDFSFCGSYGGVDYEIASPTGEGTSATQSICSYQQQLDDSRNEDVYYDEPNTFHQRNDQQQPQSKTPCDENSRNGECYPEPDIQITKELVQRLDLMVASLEMLINQILHSHNEDSWCKGMNKRQRIVARRTLPLLILRLSQVRRARRHVMEVLYSDEGEECMGTPPDIRRILGMVHAPPPIQLGRATAVANGQCLSSVQSRS